MCPARIENITNWQKEKLGAVLSTPLYVPVYQRAYAWEQENIEEFLADFQGFSDGEYETYIFGQVIFCKTDKKYIIDGQQRITTTVIFLCALRDLAIKYDVDGYDALKKTFEKYLGYTTSKGDSFNLTLGRVNKEYFLNGIQLTSEEREKREIQLPEAADASNKLIKNAYDIIYKKYDAIISKTEADARYDLIDGYISLLTERLCVSCIETNQVDQAYSIFETLNARGKALDASDLLKNYFVSVCGEEIIADWDAMTEDLQSNDLLATDYLRCYWNSKYVENKNFCRNKQLYSELSKYVKKNTQRAKKILSELKFLKDTYIYFASKKSSKKLYRNEGLIRSLACLKKIGIRTYIPIMLSLQLRNDVTENMKSKVVSDLESLIVRNLTFGNGSPHDFEEKFSEYAQDISKGCNVDSIRSKLSESADDDHSFYEHFKAYTNTNATKTKLILKELYNYGKDKGERPIPEDLRRIHLEHIMPTDNSEWNVSNSLHAAYLNKLGNLTLLLGNKNESIKNYRMEKKHERYAESDIIETKALIKVPNTESWNEKMIEDRCKYLFQTACKRWPIFNTEKQNSPKLCEDNVWKPIMEQMIEDMTATGKLPACAETENEIEFEQETKQIYENSLPERVCKWLDKIESGLKQLDCNLIRNSTKYYVNFKYAGVDKTVFYFEYMKKSESVKITLQGTIDWYEDSRICEPTYDLHRGDCKCIFYLKEDSEIDDVLTFSEIALKRLNRIL